MQLNHAILFPRHFHPILSSRWRTQSTRVIKFLDHKEAHFPTFRANSILQDNIIANYHIQALKNRLESSDNTLEKERGYSIKSIILCSRRKFLETFSDGVMLE